MITNHSLIGCGLFCFIVGTTIGFATVNAATLSVIPYLRLSALALAALVLFVYTSNLRMDCRILFAFGILLFMNSYGLLRGLDSLSHTNYLSNFGTSTIVVLTGITYIGISKSEHSQLVVAIFFVLFASIWLLFLIATGGLNLSNAIGFNFQIYSRDGREVSYSQGVSKFYGVAAIAAMWSASRVDNYFGMKSLYALSILFLTLSFLGGGRGDFLAVVIVIILMIFSSSWRGAIMATLFAFFAFLFFVEYVPKLSDDFVAARRFAVLLSGFNFGMRDILFEESIHILLNEPDCFLFGCGFASFQDYYGYRYGLYPHNILLESAITWGVPLVLLVGFLFALGLFAAGRRGFLNWMGLLFVLIGMKSGDVLGSWFALSFVYFFAGVGVSVIIDKSRNHQSLQRGLK